VEEPHFLSDYFDQYQYQDENTSVPSTKRKIIYLFITINRIINKFFSLAMHQ